MAALTFDTGRAAPRVTRQAAGTGLSALFSGRQANSHYAPGRGIMHQGAPCTHVHRIVSGTVRCATVTSEGRRQILRFARAGEYLGLDQTRICNNAAEAVDDVLLQTLPREALERAESADPRICREVHAAISAELARQQELLMVLATHSAEERLRWFLSRFAGSDPGREPFVRLPMTRRDIADHLGLSLETTSRCISHLRRNGAIELSGADRYRLLGHEDIPVDAA